MKRFIQTVVVVSLAAFGTVGCDQSAKIAKEHRIKANKAFKAQNWSEATKEFEESLKADPNQETLWQKKAQAHMKLSQTDQAVAAMKKTLEFASDTPAKVTVYRNIASLFLENGPIEQAEQYYLEALKLDPKDEASVGWLGQMFSQLGGAQSTDAKANPEYLTKALSYYDQAIALNPSNRNAYLNKRIAMTKWAVHEQQEKDAADKEASALPKKTPEDKAKIAEVQAKAAQHQAKADELRAMIEENTKKLSEMQKQATK
jgi:tetratricopeptide (TPR) repeat protein